jgi:serine/threonine protein kinase
MMSFLMFRRFVGKGSFGVVQEAIAKKTGKKYAGKTMNKAKLSESDMLEKLKLETEIMLHLTGWTMLHFLEWTTCFCSLSLEPILAIAVVVARILIISSVLMGA